MMPLLLLVAVLVDTVTIKGLAQEYLLVAVEVLAV
jgi:hypothetical protein